jgi:hypothetical protein
MEHISRPLVLIGDKLEIGYIGYDEKVKAEVVQIIEGKQYMFRTELCSALEIGQRLKPRLRY